MQPTPYRASAGNEWQNSPAPLDQPLYDASFGQAIKRFFTKYATFSGRASRSEFWWMYLFGWLCQFAGGIVAAIGGILTTDPNHPDTSGDGAVAGGVLFVIFLLGMIVPAIALLVRRLHDIDFSAWWLLLLIALQFGAIVLLIFALLRSNPRGARFDKDGGRQAMAGRYPGQPPYPPQNYPGRNS